MLLLPALTGGLLLRARGQSPGPKQIQFTDITQAAGIKFVHHSGTKEKKYIVEVNSGGVALFDYNNDGLLDIYFVNGSSFDVLSGKEKPTTGCALYRNNGDGTFTDVTAKAGVGLGPLTFSTGAAWGDYDGDGLLDLFVAGYVKFDINHAPDPQLKTSAVNYCQYRGVPVMCGPRGLKGEGDHLFHNNGDGTFTDVSVKAGVSDPNGYYGFGGVWLDYDDDGKLDLFVVNDSTPNYLYHNKGDGTFEEVGYAAGAAVNEDGREQSGMGVAVGDYDNDGREDLYQTNFSDDTNTLRHNDGGGMFTDVTFESGQTVTYPYLGWGTAFLDFDNDGWLDLFVANGHVYPEVDHYDWNTRFNQRKLLLRNLGNGKFKEVGGEIGGALLIERSSRGAAFGDIDNDGDIDVVVNNMDAAPTLIRNDGGNKAGHWLTVKLIGDPKARCPRDAIGATVFITAGGKRQRGDVRSGGSFCSQSDLRVHFGLGPATKVDKLEIKWPGGKTETVTVAGVDQFITIAEGRGIIKK